jgi:hypothetical protein
MARVGQSRALDPRSAGRLRQRLRAASLGALLAALLAAPAWADLLHLVNGKTVEGKVVHDTVSGKYIVTTDTGIVAEFPADQVVKLERSRTALDDYQRRLGAVDPGDRSALVDLAIWARERRLHSEHRDLCRRILALDPNHEMARRALGYVVFENRWVPESELEKNLGSRGLVRFQGEWMTKEEESRRLFEDARAEVSRLFDTVASENRHLQEFAIERLMAYRHERAAELFASFIDDAREIVRVVAAGALARHPARGKDRANERASAEITRRLFDRLLATTSKPEVEALGLALRYFQPAESFALAVDLLAKSRVSDIRRTRAQDIVIAALRKDQVPTLCRTLIAVENGERREAAGIRDVLVRVFDVDHGYDIEAWLAWWKQAESKYSDHD